MSSGQLPTPARPISVRATIAAEEWNRFRQLALRQGDSASDHLGKLIRQTINREGESK